MELVQGKPPKGPHSEVLEYGSRICEALDAAHRKGSCIGTEARQHSGDAGNLEVGLAKMTGQSP
jgi:hypothetical protein